MKIAVVIPWRDQESRRYAKSRVAAWYAANLPEAEVAYVDSGDEPFNLAATRNTGVRMYADHDVVILNDADTIPEIDPLRAAIEGAAGSSFVHLPYTEYRSLQAQGTMQYGLGLELSRCDYFLVDGACSGVYVTTPQTWFMHGGQDENFRGWGFEDAAWMVAHKTLLGGDPIRHVGNVYAMTHESAVKEGPQYEANAARCYLYLQAEGDVDAVSKLAFGEWCDA